MYLSVVKDPIKTIQASKKKKDVNRSTRILAVNALLVTLSVMFLVFKNILPSVTSVMALSLGVTMFFMVVLISIVFGWILEIIADTMGGKGRYYEGFTSVVYGTTAPSMGILAASLLSSIPQSWPISFIILAPSFALGIATFYRCVKEMFRLDTITTFLVVSIMTFSLLSTLYVLATINILSTLTGAAIY